MLGVLSVLVLLLCVTQKQYRLTTGHDQPAWDKFVGRVESGTLHYNTNLWLTGMKQDHQVIQREEQVSDRMGERLMFIGTFGLVVVLFQTWMVYSWRNNLRKP